MQGKYVGFLPSDLAACGFSTFVGNGGACLVCIRTPQADRHLQHIPRRITLDGTRWLSNSLRLSGSGAALREQWQQHYPHKAARSPHHLPALRPRLAPVLSGCPARRTHRPLYKAISRTGQPRTSCSTCRRLCATAACPAHIAEGVVCHTPHPSLAQTSGIHPAKDTQAPALMECEAPVGPQVQSLRDTATAMELERPHPRSRARQHEVGDVGADSSKQASNMQASAITGARHCPPMALLSPAPALAAHAGRIPPGSLCFSPQGRRPLPPLLPKAAAGPCLSGPHHAPRCAAHRPWLHPRGQAI